jgi:hypothetical protein
MFEVFLLRLSIAFTNIRCYSGFQNYIDFSRFGSRSPLHFRLASLDRFMNIAEP